MAWVKSGDIIKKIVDGEAPINMSFTISDIKQDSNYEFFYSVKNSAIDVSANSVEMGATLVKINYNTFKFSSNNSNQIIRWGCAIFI